MEAKHKLCNICFYIGHSMAKCNHASKMKCEHCSQNHSSDACKFQAFFSCSVRAASIGGGMSLQDVPIDSKSGEVARVLFDNGSQMTLVRNSFCFEHGYPRVPSLILSAE